MKREIIKIFALVLLCGALVGTLYLYASAQESKEGILQTHFMDFSNEDAVLIQYQGHTALIDTGEAKHSEELMLRLEQLGVEKLDLLILTHPDKDHIGAAAAVLTRYKVEKVVQSPYHKGSAEERSLEQALEKKNLTPVVPSEEMTISWNELTLTIYGPGAAAQVGSNESSLVTVVEYGEMRLVFGGDATGVRLKEMLALPIFPCTLYKVPHHGRDSELSGQVIAKLQPRYAVVTAPQAEAAVAQALAETGTQVFSTAGQMVRVISDGRSISVSYVELK